MSWQTPETLSADGILAVLAGAAIDLGTSSGTANALAGTSAIDTSTTFTSGRLYLIKANLLNTSTSTLAKNGGTAVDIRKNPSNGALVGGEIALGNQILLFYDGTYLQLVGGRSLTASDISGGYGRASNGSTNQTIPANTATTITLGTLVEGGLSLTTNRLVADKAGRYLVIGTALIGKDSTAGQTYLALRKNGSSDIANAVRNFTSSEVMTLTMAVVLALAASDYVTMATLSTTGHTVYSNSAYTNCTNLVLAYLGA